MSIATGSSRDGLAKNSCGNSLVPNEIYRPLENKYASLIRFNKVHSNISGIQINLNTYETIEDNMMEIIST